MWCGACNDTAEDARELFETYGDRGFVPITVLYEADTHQRAEAEERTEWAERHELTFPVITEPEDIPAMTALFHSGLWETYHPYLLVLGPDLEIVEIYYGHGNAERIADHLDQMLAD